MTSSLRTAAHLPVSSVQDCTCSSTLGSLLCLAAALGVGQLHIVERPNAQYKQSSRISKGTEKWLDVHRWRRLDTCLERMRAQGRQILVTHCDASAKSNAVISSTFDSK